MKLISVVIAMLISAGVQASAQQPIFPLRQDSAARNEFVKIAADTCLRKQRAAPENKNRSPDYVSKYCNCYARVMADMLKAQEWEAIRAGQQPPQSYGETVQRAGQLCS
jgi:hypothetical protein